MSAGPFTPRTSQPSGTMRLTCHAINCNQSFLEEYSDIRTPGPATSWDAAWHAQAYFSGGNSPVVQSPPEPPSSRFWPSPQCHGIRPGNEESHSPHTAEEMDVSPRKRLHTMRPATDFGSTVRSYSSPRSTGQNQSPTPWRKALQRGFLFPSATSCPKLVGRSPSDVYAPTETQVCSFCLSAACYSHLPSICSSTVALPDYVLSENWQSLWCSCMQHQILTVQHSSFLTCIRQCEVKLR